MAPETHSFPYFDAARDSVLGKEGCLPSEKPNDIGAQKVLDAIYQGHDGMTKSTNNLGKDLTNVHNAVITLLNQQHTHNLSTLDLTKVATDQDQLQLLTWLRTVQKNIRNVQSELSGFSKREGGSLQNISVALENATRPADLEAFFTKDAGLGQRYATAIKRKLAMEQAWNREREIKSFTTGPIDVPAATEISLATLQRDYKNPIDKSFAWAPKLETTYFHQKGPKAEYLVGGWDFRKSDIYQKEVIDYVMNVGPAQFDSHGAVILPKQKEGWKDEASSQSWMKANMFGWGTISAYESLHTLDRIWNMEDGGTTSPFISQEYLHHVTQTWTKMRNQRAIAKALPTLWKEEQEAEVAMKAHAELQAQIYRSGQRLQYVRGLINRFRTLFEDELRLRIAELEYKLLTCYGNVISGGIEFLSEDLKDLQAGGLEKLSTWAKTAVAQATDEDVTDSDVSAFILQSKSEWKNGKLEDNSDVKRMAKSAPRGAYLSGLALLYASKLESSPLELNIVTRSDIPYLESNRSSTPGHGCFTGLSWLSPVSTLSGFQQGTHEVTILTSWTDSQTVESTSSTTIQFKTPFGSITPKVQAWISGLDVAINSNLKLAVNADAITPKKFNLKVSNHARSQISKIKVSWIAYPRDHPEIWGGQITAEKDRSRVANWMRFREDQFQHPPRALGGLRELIVNKESPIDVSAMASVTTTGIFTEAKINDNHETSQGLKASWEIVVMA